MTARINDYCLFLGTIKASQLFQSEFPSQGNEISENNMTNNIAQK